MTDGIDPGSGEDPQGRRAIDPFFELVPGSDWNACVGRQGYEENYIDGFMEAAQRLVALIMDRQLMASRDTLVLPILYNARHGIELALKFAINRLHDMGAVASRHVVNHDIMSHWKHLHEADVGDERIRKLVDDLRPYVVSLANIDDDGQELRYAQDQNGMRSLDGLAVVNLRLVRHSLEAVGSVLSALKYRVIDLKHERVTGTFTGKCSRTDLITIAGMVGRRADWGDAAFDVAKSSVRERFGLGSRDFAKALDAMQASREVAGLIGIETPLCHIPDDKAVFALEQWAQANPPYDPSKKDLGFDLFEPNWEMMKREARSSRTLDDVILERLTVEEVSDLEALFYVGRGGEFGEVYEAIYCDALEKNRLETQPWVYVHHIMSKTSLLDEVVRACRIVGRRSLGDRLRAIRPGDDD